MDPSYVKGYYRRGSAHYALDKLKEAKNDFRCVVKLVPNDLESIKKVKACEKAIKERAFAEALGFEVIPPMTLVDIDSIIVDDSYNGPRYVQISLNVTLKLLKTSDIL